jgi:hypothetical protein
MKGPICNFESFPFFFAPTPRGPVSMLKEERLFVWNRPNILGGWHRNASGYLLRTTEARCSSNRRAPVQHSVHAHSFFQQSQFFFTTARVLRCDLLVAINRAQHAFSVLVPIALLVNVEVRRAAWKVHALLFPPKLR